MMEETVAKIIGGISTVVASGPWGWIVAAIILVLTVGAYAYFKSSAAKEATEKEKVKAGSTTGQQAAQQAETIEEIRKKRDEFLGKKR